MLGFGGEVNGKTEHAFNINGNPSNPEVYGMDGMITAYRNSLQQVQLSGPTLLAELLTKTNQTIREELNEDQQLKYYILLILTDGQIHDMRPTID